MNEQNLCTISSQTGENKLTEMEKFAGRNQFQQQSNRLRQQWRAAATGARLSFSFPVSRWVPCSPGPIFCAAVYFASQRACTRSAMVKEDEQKKKPYRHDDNIATEKAGGQAAGAPLHMRASLSIHITAV